jgi:hypothetical protein
MARKTTSELKARKTAMVSPAVLYGGQPVAKPASDLPLFTEAEQQAKLIKTLQALKNDRAYTVLEFHNKWASVHFEGDTNPTMIHYK